ncbi:MAG: LysM domain-containing protein [Planctomycetota bacterium]
MARETKVGLLIGLGVILLVGVILSDYVAVSERSTGAERLGQIGERAEAPAESASDQPVLGIGQRFTRGPVLPPDELTPVDLAAALPSSDDPRDVGEPVFGRVDESRASLAALAAIDDPSDPSLGVDLDDLASLLRRDADRRQARLRDTPEASLAADAEAAASPVLAVHHVEHRVRSGETLSQIAVMHYGSAGYAATLAEANPGVVGEAGRVRAGSVLRVPVRDARHAAGLDAAAMNTAVQAYAPPRKITVQPGETLSSIAARELGSARSWRKLLEANQDRLESDRDLRSGMTLRVPPQVGGAVEAAVASAVSPEAALAPEPEPEAAPVAALVHVVQPGESLYRIADRRLGDAGRFRELYELNRDRMDSETDLRPGQEIRLPAS